MNCNQVRLPHLVSDNMVLQRGIWVKIWGWAARGDKITIRFMGKSYVAMADTDGKWSVAFPPLEAGGPYTMEIGEGDSLIIKNIMVGDVWVCSGQSNMELPMKRVKESYADEIAHADKFSIRHFKVPEQYDFKKPQEDLEAGIWESSNPESVLNFTAVGYFFARALFEKYHVPIGLINASLGGSPAEAWLSEDALKAFPIYQETAQKFKEDTHIHKIVREDKSAADRWYCRLELQDQGLKGEKPWSDPSYDAATWLTIQLPAYWADGELGPINGVVWFRKEIDVPAWMIGQTARLRLGNIVDSDTAYINGVFLGATPNQYLQRVYDIPADLLKIGKNTIVIRVTNTIGRGGFVKGKPYQLEVGERIVDLKGEWRYRVGAVAEPFAGPTFIEWQPLGLFNGMIAPLTRYPMKGVIWYQGESNTRKAFEYQKLFPALIADWRQQWNQGDFPFLYVQLPNFLESKERFPESDWALIREVQLKTLTVSNTAMAVTIDIGEWNDLHPSNKKDVGERLALAAHKAAYDDKNVVHSGPIYRSMKIVGNQITITFMNIGSGLVVNGGGELGHFTIADATKVFVRAKAMIDADHVVVWNDQVLHPVAVRYAWADNPEGANLYNKEGLPASPFRTDDFFEPPDNSAAMNSLPGGLYGYWKNRIY